MSRNPVTPEGHANLVSELHHLKSVVRLSIVKDIAEARAHGDLSENSEYDDAKERQSLCEERIKRLDAAVASAEVIDVAKLPVTDRVVFGTTVVIENADSGEERQWRIVGEFEADVENGKISFKAPLGKALIGKSEGDEASVVTPGGRQTWEIVEVRYK